MAVGTALLPELDLVQKRLKPRTWDSSPTIRY